MKQALKISLMELIIGLREPVSGKEKHFLMVIRSQALPCSEEEREWFEWYKKTHHTEKKNQSETQASKVVQQKSIKVVTQAHKKIPDRVQMVLDSHKLHKQDSDALHPKRRVSGSYGSGKKSR